MPRCCVSVCPELVKGSLFFVKQRYEIIPFRYYSLNFGRVGFLNIKFPFRHHRRELSGIIVVLFEHQILTKFLLFEMYFKMRVGKVDELTLDLRGLELIPS